MYTGFGFFLFSLSILFYYYVMFSKTFNKYLPEEKNDIWNSFKVNHNKVFIYNFVFCSSSYGGFSFAFFLFYMVLAPFGLFIVFTFLWPLTFIIGLFYLLYIKVK